MTDLVIELLTNRTPPNSISPIILSVCRHISPKYDLVRELPGDSFTHECRSVLAVHTKTLGAFQIAAAAEWIEHKSDETSRRGVTFGNSIVRIAGDHGYKNVALSSSIVAKDSTGEEQVLAIERTFAEGRELLLHWRNITTRMYPGNSDLLNRIPLPSKLTLARLHKNGWLMTDNCPTAMKFKRLLHEEIAKQARAEGIPENEIRVRQADCWHHLRNTWIGNTVTVMSRHLAGVLSEDLEQIPTMYRVTMEASSLMIATEKYFGIQANYVKGKGSMFLWWIRTYHSGVYLYATARACGGTRQDGDTEGAGPVLMNLPLYLQFLAWRHGCGGGDSILEKSLFFRLRCVEMVGYLRVLSILHMCVVIPLRWLAGNCHNLSEWNFGVANMAWTVDLMNAVFLEIANDGSKIFNDEFMFGIFQPIIDTIPPFGQYMDYMFKSKTSNPIGSWSVDKKVVPWEKLRSELMYPTRRDIVQSTDIACELAGVAAITFRREFRDTKKSNCKIFKRYQWFGQFENIDR